MQLDSDGDGNVSFEEFAAAMKKKMGRLSLPPSILSKMYESVVKVNQGNDGDFDTTIDIGGRKLAVERAPHPENVSGKICTCLLSQRGEHAVDAIQNYYSSLYS